MHDCPVRESSWLASGLMHLGMTRWQHARTWYHSRETPPASIPSSPWNATDSLPRISSEVLHAAPHFLAWLSLAGIMPCGPNRAFP
jgi:hypothetical protein